MSKASTTNTKTTTTTTNTSSTNTSTTTTSNTTILKLYIQRETDSICFKNIDRNCTIETLKNLLQKKEGIPIAFQTLYYDGQKLDNDKNTLLKYGIVNNDPVICLEVPCRAGKFKNVDITKHIKRSFRDNHYLYWRIVPGFNYGGTCKNPSCKAHNQPVVCYRKFGNEIMPNVDEHYKKCIKCPGCDSRFTPHTFFLYLCKVTMIYKREEDKDTREENGPDFLDDENSYWRLGGEEHGLCNYEMLMFNVEPLSKRDEKKADR